ncbi:MAG: DUF6273 domain-containing protein [Synergistaceae bacterium]|nr:DUF6273 domain-containing protein [Synergistaceae bacterium]
MGNFKMTQRRRQGFLAMVMAVMFALSNVTVAWASPSGGIVQITDFSGGNGAGTKAAETIYFGSFWQNGTTLTKDTAKEGIKWRVLANDETKGVLLLSDQGLYADQFNSTAEQGHNWNGSDIQKTLNGTEATPEKTTFKSDGTGAVDEWGSFAGDAFDTKELGAIKETNVETDGTTSQDKLFLLSGNVSGGGEVNTGAYGFGADATRVMGATEFAQNVKLYDNDRVVENYGGFFWWLRSPGSYASFAFNVNGGGEVGEGSVGAGGVAVRPALNLNPELVLFLSAANATGKGAVTVDSGFSLDNTYTGSDGWKLTLKDTDITAPTVSSVTQTKEGDTVDSLAGKTNTLDLTNGLTVSYKDDLSVAYDAAASFTTGANYLSAVVKDSAGNYVNYAKIADKSSPSSAKVGLGTLADGTYTMYIFAENTATDDKGTDYASDFSDPNGYTIGKGTVTIFADKLSATHKGKELTANLDKGFNLSFDADTYNTSVALANNATGTITAGGTGTEIKNVSVGSGASLAFKNKFTVSNLSVADNGLLQITSDVNASTVDTITVKNALTLGDASMLKIQLSDPYFATAKEGIPVDGLTLLSATNGLSIKAENITGVATVGTYGIFTPTFSVADNNIYLTGFNFKSGDVPGGDGHIYKLAFIGAYTQGDPVPYGHVVKYDEDTKTNILYKVKNDDDKAWGLIGRGIETREDKEEQELKFDWDDESKTLKPHEGEGNGDILVKYNKKGEKKTASDLSTDATAYVGIERYGEMRQSAVTGGSIEGEVKADFIGNVANWGALSLTNNIVGTITGDFIDNSALMIELGGGLSTSRKVVLFI